MNEEEKELSLLCISFPPHSVAVSQQMHLHIMTESVKEELD